MGRTPCIVYSCHAARCLAFLRHAPSPFAAGLVLHDGWRTPCGVKGFTPPAPRCLLRHMVSGVPKTTLRVSNSAKPALEKTCSLRVALDQMYEKSNSRNSPQHIRLWCSNQLNIRTKIARMSNECSCATTFSKATFTRNCDEFHRFKQKSVDMSGPERTCTTGAGGVKPLTPKACCHPSCRARPEARRERVRFRNSSQLG